MNSVPHIIVCLLIESQLSHGQFPVIDLPSNVPSMMYYFVGSYATASSRTYFTFVKITQAAELVLCQCAPPNGITKVSWTDEPWITCDFWSSWVTDVTGECTCNDVIDDAESQRLDTDYMLVCCDSEAESSAKESFHTILDLSTVRKLENQNCEFLSTDQKVAVFGLQEIYFSDVSRLNLLIENDFPRLTMQHHSASQHVVFLSRDSLNNHATLKAFTFIANDTETQLTDDVRTIIASSISPTNPVLITLVYT